METGFESMGPSAERPAATAALATVAALAALAVGGCGRDGAEQPSGGEQDQGSAAAAEEFIAEADRICMQFTRENAQPDAFVEEFGEDPANPRAADFLRTDAENRAESLEMLAALEPPEDLQAPVEEYVAMTQEGIDLTEEMADAAEAGDGILLGELGQERTELYEERQAVADEVGFEACGQPLPQSGSGSGR